MFGHPGISAYEFAGELEREKRRKSKKKLSVKTTSIASTQDDNSTVSSPAPTTCIGSADAAVHKSQSALEDLSALQRRRGTFINHTPRGFEMRSPKKTELQFQQASTDNFSHPDTYLYSSGSHTRASTSQQSSSQHGQGSSLGSWIAEKDFVVNAGAPVELDSKEVVPSEMNVSRPATSYRGSASSSWASRVTGPSPLNTATSHSSREIAAPSIPEEKKRRRRQTPYRIASLKVMRNARHSPLDPWVAQHRREGKRSSMIDDHPPQVEIEDIGEASNFRAIQDYFDSQVGVEDPKPNRSRRLSSPNPPSIPPPNPPEFPRCASAAATEPPEAFSVEQLDIPDEPAPEIPDRSPKRLHNPSSLLLRSASAISINSDFESAAEGQYSPYDKKHDVLIIPKKRGHVCLEPAARAGTSTLGRMAPPILGHEALAATTVLNDLCFYLKNTGPSPEPIIRQKTKPGLKIFKARGKKPLAARVGSVEGSPQAPARPKPIKPACAREMTTSGGAKHLHIIIPRNTLSDDETAPVVAAPGSKGAAGPASINWTDEMLNPLASSALENALTDFNAPELPSTPGPRSPPLRSPKTPPKAPTPVPVEDHPLASRQEQTRARKLRDLKRIKTTTKDEPSKIEEVDTVAGAVQTPVELSGLVRDSLMESVHADDKLEEDSPGNKMLRLQKRAVTLQRQNIELTEALARIMGFESEDGDLNPEAVLMASRQIRYSKTPEA